MKNEAIFESFEDVKKSKILSITVGGFSEVALESLKLA